jgi:hypothetical protein
MRVEASNSKLRPKSPMHNGGPMVSSDLTFLTIGVDKLYQETNTKSKMEEKSLPSVCNM